MKINDPEIKDKILLQMDISTKSPFVRLIATIIIITVVLLYINAHMDGVISKKQIQEIEQKFEEKDVFLMKAIATTCIKEGVNPIDSAQMMSCLVRHKESALQPIESKLSGSRFKRFFILIFTASLFAMYFLLLRYKHSLIQTQENTNDQ